MDRFDVVVVGAGSAGCVVAARVAAAGAATALLEAGPDLRAQPSPGMLDGWGLPALDDEGYRDWGYHAETDAAGSTPRLRRGRLVGGTSHLTRFALRGSPADFDEWEALGNPGWGRDAVLPYFRRLETDLEHGSDPWHGDAGPMPITRYPSIPPTPSHAAARDALIAAGFSWVPDHNRPGAVGVGPMPMTSRDAVRVTTAGAYLPEGPAADLTLLADAQVASVVLDGKTATGVQLLDGSVIHAERVVLSAGVYSSPPILLRSGIGPAGDLRDLGMGAHVDLPGVGANLADHPAVELQLPLGDDARDAPILHTVTTFHSSASAPDAPPDLLLWMSDPGTVADPWFGLDVMLLKPQSRGRVSLRSAEPSDPPRIVLPGLGSDADLRLLAEGYARARSVFGLPSMKGAELREHVRSNVRTVPHVVGTCAMGPDPSAGAVVDATGRVHGTDGLYVADASIIPTPPSGFPQLVTIMLAERLAEVIAGSP